MLLGSIKNNDEWEFILIIVFMASVFEHQALTSK